MLAGISLYNFRNHGALALDCGGAKNIIFCGANGAGKTAALEAISLLCGIGNFRGAALGDMMRKGAGAGDGFAVHADLGDGTEIRISWNGGAHKEIRIDGDKSSLTALAKIMPMVWLTPRDDRLFCESASDRRAFLDRLVGAFDLLHTGRTARLAKLLSERAFAIKNNGGNSWLDPIEVNLAKTAMSVAAARVKYSAELNYFMPPHLQITTDGTLEQKIITGAPAAGIEIEYRQYLAENRFLENDRQIINGAHKSDFGMFNSDAGMPVSQTSTGQQKSALVSLVVAHAKLMRAKTGKYPVVLLDEADSHLDAAARKNIFAQFGECGAQVFATALSREIFLEIPDTKFVELDS
ncbi:MAG: hypothetical protein LBO08_03560 [Rickettsiales bacterium]|jgi:DNA replication and repair protein RecF|nr:hypothetical protein [Rickettsiales bacterium]